MSRKLIRWQIDGVILLFKFIKAFVLFELKGLLHHNIGIFLVEEYVSQDRRMGRITKHFPVNFSLDRAVIILI